ncbi:MAG: MIP/aquaporin family protein [Candidatus Methylomirabilales bacterium]
MLDALRRHWPEYLMEATGLGLFMISAGVFGTILEYPGSPVQQAVADPFLRRVLMGVAMGLTAIGIIYSPWGKQSGAHINPAVTLTFFRLGKIEPWDALFYIAAQFAGAIAGVLLVALALGHSFADPPVIYVTTLPGSGGPAIAFLAELVISFALMLVVLVTTNVDALGPYTGVFAGVLVATYITVVAPVSGMSMNPARTFGSALPAQLWESLWIYFTAPLLGMLLASEVYVRVRGGHRVFCAKLHHHNDKRCIFRCGYGNVRG